MDFDTLFFAYNVDTINFYIINICGKKLQEKNKRSIKIKSEKKYNLIFRFAYVFIYTRNFSKNFSYF